VSWRTLLVRPRKPTRAPIAAARATSTKSAGDAEEAAERPSGHHARSVAVWAIATNDVRAVAVAEIGDRQCLTLVAGIGSVYAATLQDGKPVLRQVDAQ
jgi:hypothetical protein